MIVRVYIFVYFCKLDKIMFAASGCIVPDLIEIG